MAVASAPSPRARLASNCTWPLSSVDLRARTSLLRESSRTSVAPFGCVVSSECTKAWMPSLPENAVILGRAGDLRHHDVDAGRQRADGFCDRKSSGDLGVERLFDRHLAFPRLGAALFGEAVEVVAVEIALEIAPHHRLEQIAIADAVDFERHRRGIDAHQRNAALPRARQHVSLAGEAHLRLAIAHVDVEVGGFQQRLLHLRGNAGTQRDGVTLAVLEALDAELPLLRGERGLVLAADADEWREVGALARQVLGELEADARRGGIRIDRVVEQPEAVILTHALVLLTHLGDLARLERNAQCIERRTP